MRKKNSFLFIFFLFTFLISSNLLAKSFDDILDLVLKLDKMKIQTLLNKGQKIDIFDELGRSLVLRVTMDNNIEALKFLIGLGADIDVYNEKLSKNVIDQTAFLYAGANGMNDFLKILIKNNAKTNIYNYYGGTALIPACEKAYVKSVKLLLEKTNTDINHINNLGWTALLETVILSNGGIKQQKIVKLLLLHGANKNIKDKNGLSALDHAKKSSFNAIIKLLK